MTSNVVQRAAGKRTLTEGLSSRRSPVSAQASATPSAAAGMAPVGAQATAQPGGTGLPANLQSGIESLSGVSMDHVRVHHDSAAPSQLHAHAYAQGGEIHVGPGQDAHLPHEAWHVVQQAQGRVPSTLQMAGVDVNDDDGLEREADVMGARALEAGATAIAGERTSAALASPGPGQANAPVQRVIKYGDATYSRSGTIEGNQPANEKLRQIIETAERGRTDTSMSRAVSVLVRDPETYDVMQPADVERLITALEAEEAKIAAAAASRAERRAAKEEPPPRAGAPAASGLGSPGTTPAGADVDGLPPFAVGPVEKLDLEKETASTYETKRAASEVVLRQALRNLIAKAEDDQLHQVLLSALRETLFSEEDTLLFSHPGYAFQDPGSGRTAAGSADYFSVKIATQIVSADCDEILAGNAEAIAAKASAIEHNIMHELTHHAICRTYSNGGTPWSDDGTYRGEREALRQHTPAFEAALAEFKSGPSRADGLLSREQLDIWQDRAESIASYGVGLEQYQELHSHVVELWLGAKMDEQARETWTPKCKALLSTALKDIEASSAKGKASSR